MKRVVLAGLFVLATASMAFSAARNGLNVPNEIRAKISAQVSKQKPVAPTAAKWKRGRAIDGNAELLDVPADWGKDLTKYKYAYTGDRVWFIDPTSRKVVDMIKVTR